MRRSSLLAAGSVLLPFGLYLWRLLFFGDWIVDDAGITFAYARNLAEGYGPVSQPGVPPVEGYSNPAWMLLLVPFFWLGAFDPVLTPKVLAAVLVLGTFVVLRRIVGRLIASPDSVAFLALFLIAANPSFVIWTCSGLENPLYAFLVASLTATVIADVGAARASTSRAFGIGIVAGLLAITRPDGVMFAIGYPALLLLLAPWLTREPRPVRSVSRTAVYALGFAAIAGSWFVFRLSYYGEPVPNTFYAKGSQMGQFDLARLKELVRRVWALAWSLGGPGAVLLAGFVAVRCTLLAVRRRCSLPLLTISAFALLAFALFVLLPADWMPEGRFATPLITLFCPLAMVLLIPVMRARPRLWLVSIALLAFGGGWALFDFGQRSRAFRADPTISMQSVTEQWALPYNQLVDEFGLQNASALIPDLGGTLFSCKLRIYDLAYLCDRTIARTLGGRTYDTNTPGNLKRFYDYVFEETRPTFIRSHSVWTDNSRLFNDPRLERDYHLLYQRLVPPTEWVGPWHDLDYVRKDAVPGDFEAFKKRYLELMPHLRVH